jgi:signal transduction histidine kinase
MRLRPWEGLTIKAALVLGFGATAGLWLFAGLQFAERMRSVQAEAASVNERYIQAQELLSTVRTQVLLASVYVRDALLAADPDSVTGYRRNLEQTYDAADRALERYVPILDSSAERSRVEGLRREIEAFRAAALGVLSGDPGQWPTDVRLLLTRDIGPRRDAAVRVSDDIQGLNRAAFIRQQAEVASLYADAQRRVWQRLGMALGASLFIAVVASMYVVRLERDLRRRRAQESHTTEELQRLSARLVSAQEEERRTIARELHDEVGQVLMAIKVELSVAQREIEARGGARTLLDDAQQIADGALNTVRDLSRLLHPSLLDDLGLPAAVDWYLNGIAARHGLRVDLVQEGMEARLAPEIEAASFRIVQEALTNVVRHARASGCYVYLGRVDDRLRLVVQDDGVGFDPEDQARTDHGRRGLGLIGIRERASHLGGTARVEAAPGRGTRLIVELPGRVRPAVADVEETSSGDVGGLPNLEMIRG